MSKFRGLGYADAVRLLGGKDNRIVTALDKITGGILLGAAVGVPALLGWFEARAEFARLSQDHGRSKIVLGVWITIRGGCCDVIMSGAPGGGR
jgi:hypothetical protein